MENLKFNSELSQELKEKLIKKSEYYISTDKEMRDFAKLVIPFIESEEFGQTYDYLHCKVEHLKQIENLKNVRRGHNDIDEVFYELRHELQDVSRMIRDNIRHGKRTREIDELISKIALLKNLAGSTQPTINISSDSPTRCNNCNEKCMSANRKMTKYIHQILELIKKNG